MTKLDDQMQFFFFTFLKKITMTKSCANFLSPEPNEQGFA